MEYKSPRKPGCCQTPCAASTGQTGKAAAIELGTRGGKKTAERGAEYFSQISAMWKERKDGRPRRYQDVPSSGQSPASVRFRSAFVIAKRAKDLGMDPDAIAEAIGSSVQYTANLLQSKTVQSDEKIQAIIKGLDLDNLKADQIKTFAAEDRRRHDGHYRRDV